MSSRPEASVLKPSEVILSFDGVDIANDGTVSFRQEEHISFSYLVSQKYIGDKALVRVLLNSETLEFSITLGKYKELILAHIEGKPPPYYIVAGLVFTPVSVLYLASQSNYDKLKKHMSAMAQSMDEELVIISQVLVADINIGYEDIDNTQVVSFNCKPVKNLKILANMVEYEEYLKFGLDRNEVIVLRTKTAKEATPDILKTHSILSSMSNDLKAKDNMIQEVESLSDDFKVDNFFLKVLRFISSRKNSATLLL